MHHIAKVAVEGFWENHDFELRLFPEVTFLIGQNGTGKTTLINLLAAALTADFRTLDRIPFHKITIFLAPNGKGVAPKITISKAKKSDRPFEQIEYRVNSGAPNSKDIKFALEDIEEQLTVRRVGADPRRIQDYYRRLSLGLAVNLKELVQVNWLSVHRTVSGDRTQERVSYESSVDQRLESLSNDLARFFATLSRQKDDEVRSFQESIFISLLDQPEGKNLFDARQLNHIDDFKDALINIFKELHIPHSKTESKLLSFINRAEQTKTNFQNLKGHVAFEDVIILLGVRRIADAVDRWKDLQKRLSTVFSSRDRWQKITNELFIRKRMEITDSNELQFISRTGKTLTPQMLSSGEKQLLILLSETLLQREQPAIFIADEPELSLHVTWQEKLVASLRALNPSAQIIAATHSPDIVGALSDRAIDMESLIQ